MQPRKALTKEQALALAADALREVGLEEQARLVEDDVRFFLVNWFAANEWFTLEYENRICDACGRTCDVETDLHEEDCFVLHAWKYLGDPRWQAQFDANAALEAEEAAETARRAEAARLIALHGQCSHTPENRGRCALYQGHDGEHLCRYTMGGINNWLKEAYSPERIENAVYGASPLQNLFGVDRSADPVRLTGVITETPVGHFDETGAWHPNHKGLETSDPASKLITDPRQVPSLIVSPFVKEGDAFLFNNTLAVSQADAHKYSFAKGSPADAIRRAKEALERMGKP